MVIGHILTLAPLLNDVYSLLKHRAHHWNDIGRELGLSFIYREEMKREGVMTLDAEKLESYRAMGAVTM